MNNNKTGSECQTMPLFVVYVIWCRVTGKYYVGVTQQQVEQRIRQHKKGKQFVDREIKRIGWDGNWDWWIVESHVPANLITEREQYWVSFFCSRFPNGYNKTCGGIKHFKHSEETCEKISAAHSGRKKAPFTEEHRANIAKSRTGEKNPNYGKPAHNRGVPCAEETKDKIRQKLTGRKRLDQSERMRGENNPNFGKPMPDETRDKLRKRALERDMSGENNPHYGKKHTEEVKAAQSARMKGENNPNYGKSPANKGVPHTPEARAKMSAAQSGEKNGFFGKHHSEETRAKMRAKALEREAKKRAEKAAKEAATAQETAQTTP